MPILFLFLHVFHKISYVFDFKKKVDFARFVCVVCCGRCGGVFHGHKADHCAKGGAYHCH